MRDFDDDETGIKNPILKIIVNQMGQQIGNNPMNLRQMNPMMNEGMNMNQQQPQMNMIGNIQMNQINQNNPMNYNPMMQNSDNNMMNNNMNMIQQNEQFENPGMNINPNIIGNAMNQGMMTQMQQQIMQQMLILQNGHLGLGHQGEKPNFTKIEEDLSKLYDKDIKNIESIYNSICLILKYKEMIKNQDDKIK